MDAPTILAIDDQNDNLITLSALLIEYIPGCVVLTAATGIEGIEKARSLKPDAILLDIQMPGMDGFEVCQILKSDISTSHIPLIFLTAAYTDSKSRIRALEIGGDAFLAKPIDQGELIAQVKAMLRIKMADEALRQSEQKYRTLFENMTDVFFRTDLLGNLLMVSPSGAEVFGYENANEMIGINVPEVLFIRPEEWESILNNTTAKDQTTHQVEFKRQNGDQITVEANIKILYDANGRPAGAEQILRDISDRKHVVELRESNERLEKEIKERNIAEQEKASLEVQLRQAQKMEAVGTLAGGIAHDFNNILAAIIGYTELSLMDVPIGMPVRFNLEQIQSSALRARDLVKQILSFSRQTEQTRKTINLDPIIKETVKLLRATIPTTIEIVHEIDPDLNPVEADPTQIHQLILNLGGNAADAMKKSGGVMRLSLVNVSVDKSQAENQIDLAQGNYVKITITDSGQGIPPDIIERIFDPFFTTKEVGSGTGMGLSVVHGIVKGHGGSISVESKFGQGASFHIYLPVSKSTEPYEEKNNNSLMKGVERVLFVDDEISLAEFARQMLDKLGYKPVIKHSGPEALDAFRKDPDSFDLIITDMAMPHMTGAELSMKIMEIRPNMPIILCTGYSDQIDELKSRELGIKKMLLKPLSVSEASRAIREVLGKSRPY